MNSEPPQMFSLAGGIKQVVSIIYSKSVSQSLHSLMLNESWGSHGSDCKDGCEETLVTVTFPLKLNLTSLNMSPTRQLIVSADRGTSRLWTPQFQSFIYRKALIILAFTASSATLYASPDWWSHELWLFFVVTFQTAWKQFLLPSCSPHARQSRLTLYHLTHKISKQK
jgi:hypothetical protein